MNHDAVSISTAPAPAGAHDEASASPVPSDGATPQATLSVCVTCRVQANTAQGYVEPGRSLVAALQERLDGSGVEVRAVQCFAVCTRPCTIAVQAPGKWAQITGDLSLERDLDAIVAWALAYAQSADGVTPWALTPMAFRRGSIARLPPAPVA